MVEATAFLLALIIIPLTGGSFRRLAELQFDASWLLFSGLGLQIVIQSTDVIPADHVDTLGFGLLLASYVLILGFGMMNLRITGMAIITIGIALNTVVIAANQGMPYRPTGNEPREISIKHRPERPGDVLTVLDDRIYVPGPLPESVSFGDLILGVGIIDVAYRASRPTRRSARRRRRRARDLGGDEPSAPAALGGRVDAVVDAPRALEHPFKSREHPRVVDVPRT